MFKRKKKQTESNNPNPELQNSLNSENVGSVTETAARSDDKDGAGAVSEMQFEKNIKTLWIYTTLFCLFALVLIVVSSIIQGKINSKAEYYQDRYESAQTSSQSTIKNIQDENEALKRDLETYKKKAERLELLSGTDTELLNEAAELIENADYLLAAQKLESDGEDKAALAEFNKVNSNKLTSAMRQVYDELRERLD